MMEENRGVMNSIRDDTNTSCHVSSLIPPVVSNSVAPNNYISCCVCVCIHIGSGGYAAGNGSEKMRIETGTDSSKAVSVPNADTVFRCSSLFGRTLIISCLCDTRKGLYI